MKVSKKLSTETKYTDRFVWIETDKNEFHWGKNDEYTFHSKGVNLKTHVTEVKVLDNNSFELVLVEKDLLPEHLYRPGLVFSSTAPASVDIYMEDVEECENYVNFLREMMTCEGELTA